MQHQRKFSRRQLVFEQHPECAAENIIKLWQGQQCSTKNISVEDNLFAEQHNNGTAEREQHYSSTAPYSSVEGNLLAEQHYNGAAENRTTL